MTRDRTHFLMTLHKKLDRWLQLGGHADGDADTAQVALREAREESGMQDIAFFSSDAELLPFDIDVHVIPERVCEPAHLHHDIRYLLVAELQFEPHDDPLLLLAWEPVQRGFVPFPRLCTDRHLHRRRGGLLDRIPQLLRLRPPLDLPDFVANPVLQDLPKVGEERSGLACFEPIQPG